MNVLRGSSLGSVLSLFLTRSNISLKQDQINFRPHHKIFLHELDAKALLNQLARSSFDPYFNKQPDASCMVEMSEEGDIDFECHCPVLAVIMGKSKEVILCNG